MIKAKELPNEEIEAHLFDNAKNRFVEETETQIIQHGKGKNAKTQTRIIKKRKYVQANAVSQIFFLKNRSPDRWKDKREDLITINDREKIREKTAELVEHMEKYRKGKK